MEQLLSSRIGSVTLMVVLLEGDAIYNAMSVAQKTALAKQWLLNEHYGPTIRLTATSSGAPQLDGTPDAVSISHTTTALAMAFAPHPVGVDVEEKARCNPRLVSRILTVRERTILEAQNECIATISSDLLSACWTSKEAVYKLLSPHGVRTITQVELQFSATDGLPQSATFEEHRVRLHHFQFLDHWGTVATPILP